VGTDTGQEAADIAPEAAAGADTALEAAPAAAAPSEVSTLLLDRDPMTLALPPVTPFRCSVVPAWAHDTSDGAAVQVSHADSVRLAKPMITHPA
jgi:hypothetical protein